MDKNDNRIPVLFSLASSCSVSFAAFKGKFLEACGLSCHKNAQFFYLHNDLKVQLCETTWAAFMHFLKGRTDYTVSLELETVSSKVSASIQDSHRRALVPLHADDNYEDDDEEATLELVEAEDTLAYQDWRQRRGRASRINVPAMKDELPIGEISETAVRVAVVINVSNQTLKDHWSTISSHLKRLKRHGANWTIYSWYDKITDYKRKRLNSCR
ncbi:hypothetical protein P5673_010002 [Acropora cervicornis]|uniref:Uncharacterized protein n=1 Tax=Acropora cervicornis TaxID=6130 RepID=A0AAD9V9R6_ACRCE|nr:hypothetical protein P5673_010002 [Acropora cervicornis]